MIPFDDFWNAYPRKMGRVQAERTWRKMTEEDRQWAVWGLEVWKRTAQWSSERGKFIPYGSTFLNQRRYADDVVTEVAVRDNLEIKIEKPVRPDYLEFVRLRDAGKTPKGMTWETWRTYSPDERQKLLT